MLLDAAPEDQRPQEAVRKRVLFVARAGALALQGDRVVDMASESTASELFEVWRAEGARCSILHTRLRPGVGVGWLRPHQFQGWPDDAR